MAEKEIAFKARATKKPPKDFVVIKTSAMIRDGSKVRTLSVRVWRTGAIEFKPHKTHRWEKLDAASGYYIAVKRRVEFEKAAGKKKVKP